MNVVVAAIAVGLALDCFSVALGAGILSEKFDVLESLKMSASFGAFQSGMLLAGWSIRDKIVGYFSEYDHWIAFILLTAVAAHMIYDAFRKEADAEKIRNGLLLILTLSIATSIDALAVGFSLPVIETTWIISAFTATGLAAFTLTITGYYFGAKTRCLIGEKAGAAGGVILLMVGLKILMEHLFA